MIRELRRASCLFALLGAVVSLSWIACAQAGRITSYPLGESFETIQEAIEASPAMSTIVIRSGTYVEHLIIDKPLTLLGIGNVVLGSPDPEAAPDDAVLRVADTGGVTVADLAIESQSTGIEMRRSSCTILNCALNVDGIGILIESRGSERVLIERCEIQAPKTSGSGAGVLILGAGSVDISDCTFQRLATGLVVSGLTTATVRDCSFTGCFDGLVASDIGDAILIGNRFEGSRNVALRVGWTPQPYPGGLVGRLAFVDNVILDSAQWGIDLCVDVDDGTRRLLFEGPIAGSGNLIEDTGYGAYCPTDYAWPEGFFAEPEGSSE